jgi:hypothetical protein
MAVAPGNAEMQWKLSMLLVAAAAPGASAFGLLSEMPQPSATLTSCPTEETMTSSGNTQVKWRVNNHGRIALKLFWVSFSGTEQFMERALASDTVTLTTYAGHAWRVRAADGTLVAQAHASSEPLHVSPCREMYGAYELVLPPQLKSTAAALRARVDATWRGEALNRSLHGCDPWRFLSATPYYGLHVLCVHGADGDAETPAAASVFADGLYSATPSALLPLSEVCAGIASHHIPSHPITSNPIPSHPIPSHRIPSHPIASHRMATQRLPTP